MLQSSQKKEAGALLLVHWDIIRCWYKCLPKLALQGINRVTGQICSIGSTK